MLQYNPYSMYPDIMFYRFVLPFLLGKISHLVSQTISYYNRLDSMSYGLGTEGHVLSRLYCNILKPHVVKPFWCHDIRLAVRYARCFVILVRRGGKELGHTNCEQPP